MSSLPLIAHSSQEHYYNIAHMANSSQLVDWAVTQGANGIEADLQFKNNVPSFFQHGLPCDCTFSPLADICRKVGFGSPIKACLLQENATTYLMHLASQSKIALFIVDTKSTTIDNSYKKIVGKQVVQLLNQYLFAMGYRGKVIISVSKLKENDYIQGVADEIRFSPYKDRIFITFDEETDVTEVLKTLIPLSKNRVYGTGITTAIPKTFYKQISQAVRNEKSSVIGLTYIWTIDKDSSMKKYLELGARGILTNNPATLSALLQSLDKKLATPEDPIFPATSDVII